MVLRCYIFFLVLLPTWVNAQEEIIKGSVTFKTSKNIYVRFANTERFQIGDTLSWFHQNAPIKSLIIRQKSSASCMVENVYPQSPEIGQEVYMVMPPKVVSPVSVPEVAISETNPPASDVTPAVTLDTIAAFGQNPLLSSLKKQSISGRFTLSTNSSFQQDQSDKIQRLRASAALNFQNIGNSDFSLHSYFTYRHRYGIDQLTSDFYDDFKILSLAAHWQAAPKLQFWLGRRNNRYLANLGAIDGMQTEFEAGKFSYGVFAGTRPDFQNFTFNANLPQIGVYAVRKDQFGNGTGETSIAIAEQRNHFKTDRRFLYFQHQNQFLNHLQFFVSTELDLYKKIQSEVSTKPQLTSLYTSLRYKIRKNLSVTASYDNRRNVIYYESYQTFIDQLVAQETRQGVRLQLQWHIWKNIQLSGSSFLRYQGNNPKPTKNHIATLNINRIVGNRLNSTLTFNQLESFYFKGYIAGARMADQFWKGKIQLDLNYRFVNYTFFQGATTLKQQIIGANLNLLLIKNTSLILSYEITSEPNTDVHRYFITISQRLKN